MTHAITCSNCNNLVDFDLEKMAPFCPYCGQKMMVEIEVLRDIVKEKEETKRVELQEETKHKALDAEYKSDRVRYTAIAAVMFLFVVFCLVCIRMI